MLLSSISVTTNEPILEFSAGKMTFVSGNKVVPDPRKGVLSLIATSPGRLYKFCWTPINGDPPENTEVLHGTSTFERVEKCTTGVVFALCIKGVRTTANTRMWWLQEKDASPDEYLEKICKAIGANRCKPDLLSAVVNLVNNSIINQQAGNAPAASSAQQQSPSQLASTPAPPQRSATTLYGASASLDQPRTEITQDSLNRIISLISSITNNNNVSATVGSDVGSTTQSTPASIKESTNNKSKDIDLQKLLNSNVLLEALKEDPEFYKEKLRKHLPVVPTPNSAIDSDSLNIIAEVRNPQMSAAVSLLQSSIPEPGVLTEICRAFNLPAPSTDDLNALYTPGRTFLSCFMRLTNCIDNVGSNNSGNADNSKN